MISVFFNSKPPFRQLLLPTGIATPFLANIFVLVSSLSTLRAGLLYSCFGVEVGAVKLEDLAHGIITHELAFEGGSVDDGEVLGGGVDEGMIFFRR